MSKADNGSCSLAESLTTLILLAAAAVSPLILTAAAAGYFTMKTSSRDVLLPAIGILGLGLLLASAFGWKRLYRDALLGMGLGVIGTIGLEAVRIVGFRVFDSMPGSLPMLMGVMITDQFMQGPTLFSNLLGWGYHFWNGASFGLLYLLVFGHRRWEFGVAYGLVIGVIFMASPVVVMTGAGPFGSAMGPGFAVTVLLAHAMFGGILGALASRKASNRSQLWRCLLTQASRLRPRT